MMVEKAENWRDIAFSRICGLGACLLELLCSCVESIDIGLVMLAVVKLHDCAADLGLQSTAFIEEDRCMSGVFAQIQGHMISGETCLAIIKSRSF